MTHAAAQGCVEVGRWGTAGAGAAAVGGDVLSDALGRRSSRRTAGSHMARHTPERRTAPTIAPPTQLQRALNTKSEEAAAAAAAEGRKRGWWRWLLKHLHAKLSARAAVEVAVTPRA